MMRVWSIKSQNPVYLLRSSRLATYCIGSGLWLSGVLWLIFHYFLRRQTEFGLHPHPMEFWWRAAHGLFCFASLWTMGFLWKAHIVGAWRSGRHRGSGGVLLSLLAWLSVTGYLLYYLGNEQLLTAVVLLHWSVGVAIPIPFAIHCLSLFTNKNSR